MNGPQGTAAAGGSHPSATRRLPRHRKTLLIASLILATCLLSWIIGLPAVGGVKQFREAGMAAAQPGGVEFRSDTPDVRIRPSSDGKVHVSARGEYSGARPLLSVNPDQGGVLVIVNCYAEPTRRCQLSVDLQIPQGTQLVAKTSSGPMDVSGLAGPTYLRTDSGSVTLNRLSGSVNVTTLSGVTRGTGLGGRRVTVDSSSGPVSLNLVAVPASIRISSGSAPTTVVLPRADYRVRTDSGGGAVRVSVPRSSAAFSRLDLTAQDAPITVRVADGQSR